MKRTLLSALAVCAIAFSANAQTFADGDAGYTVDFRNSSGTCLLNIADPNHTGAYAFAGGNISTAGGSSAGADKFLRLTSGAGTLDATVVPGYFDLHFVNGANCDAMADVGAGIDMSAAGDGKLVITAKSDVDGAQIRIYVTSTAGGFPASGETTYNMNGAGDAIIEVITLTTSYDEYEIDFTDVVADATLWSGFTTNNINGIGFTLLTASANYDIRSIKFGEDAVLTGIKPATLPESVKIGPNPVNDVLNLDLSSLNMSGADLKILNTNGSVVKEAANTSSISVEGLSTGMYFLQVGNYKPVKISVQ